MNPVAPTLPGVEQRELTSLIATLYETERRLEQLTGGEVDAVADSDGRIILLREAQERLRHRESTRQAAILNALPANIALLDAHGVIISVNEAWRQFADANMMHAPGHAVGLNYLAICDSARGDHSAEAHAVAQGIRAVLADQLDEYSIEYPCHSPTQERWFHLVVTPLTAHSADGAVVMHRDISRRKQADAALEALSRSTAQRERVLSSMLASISDFAYVFDRGGRFVFANQPLLDLWGITSPEAVGKNFHELGYPEELAGKLQSQIEQVFVTGQNLSDETPYTGAAGELGYYEYIFSPVIAPDGTVEFVVGTTRDISERKRAEITLQRQEHEQRELAEQLALERSRLVDAQRIGKIGSWIKDLTSSTLSWSDETHRIYETDPASFLPTHEAHLALVHPDDREMVEQAFNQSLADHSPCQASPYEAEYRLLLPDGRIKFIEKRWQVFFDEAKNALRAVGTSQDITERKQAQRDLLSSEIQQRLLAQKLKLERSRLVAAQRVAKVGSWEADLATMEVLWSDEIHRIFGTDPETFFPNHKTFLEFVHPDDRARVDKTFVGSLDQHGMFAIKHRLLLRDGTEKFAEERWQVSFDELGKPRRVFGTCQDITESETAATSLQEYKDRLSLATRSANLGIWDWDVTANVMIWDSKMRSLYGIREEDFTGAYDAWSNGLHPEDRERAEAEIAAALTGVKAFGTDFRVIWPNGEIRDIRAFGTVKRAEDGTPERMTGVNWDVTEQNHVHARLARLNRVQEIRSQINALIVRVGDRDELFRQACRIAVEQGGFHMSLVAIHDPISGHLLPVASAGKSKQLLGDIQRMQTSGDLAPHSMITRGFTEKRTIVSNHSRNDPQVLLASSYAEAGINSLAVLPLIAVDGAIGVFVLYSAMADFFQNDELKLLGELTDDIVFAIDHIGKSKRLLYLNRVYAMLSGISLLASRATNKQDLYDGACRIAVELGGFRVAVLGVVHDGKVEFVALHTVDEEAEAAARNALAGTQEGPTAMVATAMREKEPCISNDSRNDPEVAHRDAHFACGIRSMAILPLVVASEVTGILALYANENDFFHEEEIRILTELATDVALAVDHIGNQDRLKYLAYYDSLTGLANRSLFIERADQCVRAAASGERGVALVLVDLERFKSINDSLGQALGDELLRQVGAWLGERIVGSALLGRVGSDHFAMMLHDAHTPADAARDLEKLIAEFHATPFELGGSAFRISAKFGVSMFPEDGSDAESLFTHAEAALKKAKAGGDRYLFYTQKMTDSVARKLTLENQLRLALDNEEFVLHYQPKVNLQSGRLTSAEALIRWNDPRSGLVPPGMFIPVLEETGLIYEVGRWALRKSLEDYLRWRNAGLPAVRIAVNVSPMQLRHPDFVAEVQRVIGIDAHAADGLELEITESMIMADVIQGTASLQSIRDMGITIAIDDFGTGYSSLGYLSKLPVNTLKIDRSFIIQMTQTSGGLSLVSTMINLAHSLNLKVVAEGVETEEQSNLLRLLKCDEMQGYLFSKPVPGDVFEERFLVLPPGL